MRVSNRDTPAEKQTDHVIHYGDASKSLKNLESESIALVVTSPPYPLVSMWDECFTSQNKKIRKLLAAGKLDDAFELMHQVLDPVWTESYRLLIDGGFLCINFGDTVRDGVKPFQMFNSHMRILSHCKSIGFTELPCLIWRKISNSPTKFQGSGMQPCIAYVTMEHEYIVILRKGKARYFKTKDPVRRSSSYFYGERNMWFSDLWDNTLGEKQELDVKLSGRDRSGAYPLEIPYRLINMHTVKGDTVLDPFLGIGTTSIAAICSERNSIGIEYDRTLKELIDQNILTATLKCNKRITQRFSKQLESIGKRMGEQLLKKVKCEEKLLNGKTPSKKEKPKQTHFNKNHGLPVVRDEETDIVIRTVEEIVKTKKNHYSAIYDNDLWHTEETSNFWRHHLLSDQG